MTKKSLFLGAAAVALLVLLALAGCSNPSSSDTAYVSQAASDYPYPADTVFVDNRAALEGLLNEYSAETNQVRNIGFTGNTAALALAANPLIIPTGKTVYLVEDHVGALGGNITVREGAKLVLVGNFTAGIGGSALLVRGEVEVFRSLRVTTSALDVADYSVENAIEAGRNTVIGKNVTILPGAALILDVEDIIPPTENQPNKFTPAQAWIAAGQGHLVIGRDLPLNALTTPGNNPATNILLNYDYKVSDLLVGVSPSRTRFYTVSSGRTSTEELPAVIPLGAFIRTTAIPQTSVGNTLTVNGTLFTNGTLREITKIEVGNGGFLGLAEDSSNVLQGLTDLRLGPGATFGVNPANPNVALESLETLFLGDGSTISVNAAGTSVTFKEDEELALTVGKKVTYLVGMSPAAVVNTVISKDAGLVNGSNLTVHPGSTFTVEEGAAFTVEGGSTFDISAPGLGTGTAPAVTINGVVEIAGDGTIVGPSAAAVLADPGVLYKTISLGTNGKIVLDYGAEFEYANATPGESFVGANGSGSTYEWVPAASDGAQIEINAQGLVIRDTDATAGAEVTVAADGAIILKTQTLTLDRNVTLTLDETLTLLGDAAGGATLLGSGVLAVGADAEITGGDFGWQAVGANNIIIDGSTSTIQALDNASPAGAGAAALTAKGLGANITVLATGTALTIDEVTTIALGGNAIQRWGLITLIGAAADPGEIAFTDNTSKITTGHDGTGGSSSVLSGTPETVVDAGSLDEIGITNLIGDTSEATVASTAAADLTADTMPAGYLVSLAGDSGGSVTGGGLGEDGKISSETRTLADTTP